MANTRDDFKTGNWYKFVTDTRFQTNVTLQFVSAKIASDEILLVFYNPQSEKMVELPFEELMQYPISSSPSPLAAKPEVKKEPEPF